MPLNPNKQTNTTGYDQNRATLIDSIFILYRLRYLHKQTLPKQPDGV